MIIFLVKQEIYSEDAAGEGEADQIDFLCYDYKEESMVVHTISNKPQELSIKLSTKTQRYICF